MSNTLSPSPQSILFFGMRCAFSAPPLAALMAAGHDIRAVVLPGPPFGPLVLHQSPARPLPIADRRSEAVDDLIRRALLPIVAIRDPRHPHVIAAIAERQPSVIVVACFPWLLPRAILDLPPLGCLNVHPSLLPAGRGPDPVAETLRNGDAETGTTIHLMDDRFDTGPILLQERIAVPDGITAPDLEHRLAVIGGRLLVDAIDHLVNGTARPIPQVALQLVGHSGHADVDTE